MKAMIMGAGLVGSLLAVLLRKKGFEVVIYERYPDTRSIPSQGRSINLVLTVRGIRALEMIGEGLAEELIALTVAVTGRSIHQISGDVVFQRYGKDDSEFNYSISRSELNQHLITRAENAGAHVRFNHQLLDYHPDTGLLTFEVGGAQSEVSTAGCWVFGADGAGSPLRRSLQRRGFLTSSETLLSEGYKELLLPLNHQGEPPLSVHALHLWPRGAHMLMALPNKDGTFTGTLYLPNSGPDSFESLNSPEAVVAFFRKNYPDAIAAVGGEDRLVAQVLNNPVGLLGTVRCSRSHHGNVLLIGDAAHAILPFYGQGTNCGFEDCYEVWKQLEQWEQSPGGDLSEYLSRVDVVRRPNSNAIADMAHRNFLEMRDLAADSRFLLMKAVENELEKRFPLKFRSEYAMVCYGGLGNVSYENAQTVGKVQSNMLEELCRGLNRVDDLDLARAEELIERYVVPVHRRLSMDLSTISVHSLRDRITRHDPSSLRTLSAKL